ncbi:Galactose-1-phosphate uridylyltransferase [Actinobaculum suis]|uniref:DUF4921 family protein n=1 Tax=Actinobaculum suis TaxID=1657 RepID=A0A1G7CN25_9ACTO|nr:DUF4921 family protein [Actinobaculum suis]MDY5152525.1 DUF4921 family protein [Actinobaculum suis]SDE40170.1 Galactose-1-phosphate uridylyltransferase [Actinobaculum suis]
MVQHFDIAAPISKLPDGTIKQRNPFSGTQVWTVPGRADRPLRLDAVESGPLSGEPGKYCAFCADRVLETPPEKSRIDAQGNITRNVPVDVLADPWEFRRIPNLFEIVPYSYWTENYGYTMPSAAREHMERYVADPAGRAHVLSVQRQKALASKMPEETWNELSEREKLDLAEPFFGGGHDLIVAHDHYLPGATDRSQRFSSGTMTPEQHYVYMKITADAMAQLYAQNRYVKYVQVFQNWLKPAGASFDHLHKQLVSIDSRSVNQQYEVPRIRENPNIFNEYGPDYAGYQNLVIAENEHAVAYAGFGHRYPTLEVWSRSEAQQPFDLSEAEFRDVSDLVHAMHAATGPDVPTNEEWYAKSIDMDVPAPWRVLIKWRVSTLAGFEGGTKIYVNTIDPWSLRDRVVPVLLELRADGKLAPGISIATECTCEVNSLRYARGYIA